MSWDFPPQNVKIQRVLSADAATIAVQDLAEALQNQCQMNHLQQ